jgi:hypothetical protein
VEFVPNVPKKRNDGTLLASEAPRPLSETGPGNRPLPPTPDESGTLVTRRPPRTGNDVPGARTSVLPDLLPQTSDQDVSIYKKK